MSVSQEELTRFFEEATKQSEFVTEAQSLCKAFSLSAEELSFKWDAFSYNYQSNDRNNALKLNADSLRMLRRDMQFSQASKSKSIGTPRTPAPGPLKSVRKGNYSRGMGIDGILNTPSPGLKSKNMAQGDSTPSSITPSRYNAHNKPSIQTPVKQTPMKSEIAQPSPPSSDIPTSKRVTRKTVPETIETLNSSLATAEKRSSSSHQPQLAFAYTYGKDRSQFDYRYMYENLIDRSDVLDNRIEQVGKEICEFHGIDYDEVGDPSIVSTETIPAIGRICTESDGARLNDVSIWFEPSKMKGAGDRVMLSFNESCTIKGGGSEGGVGLFPGMILGIRGKNSGSYFSVNEILLPPPLDTPLSYVNNLIKYQHSSEALNGEPLSIMISSGPYSLDSNLDFEPFMSLLQEIESTQPHFVIMLGPFVDANHPSIKNGDIDCTCQDLFRNKILAPLSKTLSETNTTAVIVPSTKDIVNSHFAYPQAPFDPSIVRNPSSKPIDVSKIKFVPNPGFFRINEVSFAVTTTESLFHLRTQEYFKNATEMDQDNEILGQDKITNDVVARSCRHLLRQRNLYPVFPSPLGPQYEPLNLDVSHLDLANIEQPVDVIITPSQLGKHFAKIVDSTVFINPGFLSRKNQFGTFSKMTVHPQSLSELKARNGMEVDNEAEQVSENMTWERCRVDVVRI